MFFTDLGLACNEIIIKNFIMVRYCTLGKTDEADEDRKPIRKCLELALTKRAKELGIEEFEEYLSVFCLNYYLGANLELKLVNLFNNIRLNHSKKSDSEVKFSMSGEGVFAYYDAFDLKKLFNLTSKYDPECNFPTHSGLFPVDEEHRNKFNETTANDLLDLAIKNKSYVHVKDLMDKYPDSFVYNK